MKWIKENKLVSLLILVAIIWLAYMTFKQGGWWNTYVASNKRIPLCTCPNGKVHPSMKAGAACDDACSGLIH